MSNWQRKVKGTLRLNERRAFNRWKKLPERERTPPESTWLTDHYIYQKLGVPRNSLPHEIIQLKRELILLKRYIKHIYS